MFLCAGFIGEINNESNFEDWCGPLFRRLSRLCFAALICDICPQIIYSCSTAIGFVNPANFLFLGAIVLLLAISLSLSVAVSRHVLAIKNLTHRIALLEKELEKWSNHE